MQAISELRRLARERRDKAIAAATAHYEATLKRIAEIEQDLLGKEYSDHKRMSRLILQAIPETPFTILDVLAKLEAMDTARVWQRRSVTNQIGRFRQSGVLKRLRRPTVKSPAVYVRTGVSIEPTAFQDQTMLDAAAELLRVKPMNVTELALSMLESGFKTRMGKKALRAALATGMRGNRERFGERGGKWTAA